MTKKPNVSSAVVPASEDDRSSSEDRNSEAINVLWKGIELLVEGY
jgi:hypothetical protein